MTADVWPGAMWRPIPEDQTQPTIVPEQLILHTAVDGRNTTTMFPWWTSTGNNLESTGYVQQGGGIEQYLRCTVRADANNKANSRATSLETWDGWAGNSGQVETAWNHAQLNAIILFAAWWCDTYRVPRRLCPAWDKSGIGYHKQFPEWSPGPTGCPGDVRAEQVRDVIIPALNFVPGPPPVLEEDDMKQFIAWDPRTGYGWNICGNTKVYLANSDQVEALLKRGVEEIKTADPAWIDSCATLNRNAGGRD